MKNTQKKFYSSEEVNAVVEKHAEMNNLGFSKALRNIVLMWAGGIVTLPKVKSDNKEYLNYLNNPDTLDPRN